MSLIAFGSSIVAVVRNPASSLDARDGHAASPNPRCDAGSDGCRHGEVWVADARDGHPRCAVCSRSGPAGRPSSRLLLLSRCVCAFSGCGVVWLCWSVLLLPPVPSVRSLWVSSHRQRPGLAPLWLERDTPAVKHTQAEEEGAQGTDCSARARRQHSPRSSASRFGPVPVS